MVSQRAELILKAAKKIDDLQVERASLTADIDRRIREAEAEFESLIGEGPGTSTMAGSGHIIASGHGTFYASRQDAALAFIRQNPKISTRHLALAVYGGDDDQSQNRTRSLLHALITKEKIRKTDQGFVISDE